MSIGQSIGTAAQLLTKFYSRQFNNFLWRWEYNLILKKQLTFEHQTEDKFNNFMDNWFKRVLFKSFSYSLCK